LLFIANFSSDFSPISRLYGLSK